VYQTGKDRAVLLTAERMFLDGKIRGGGVGIEVTGDRIAWVGSRDEAAARGTDQTTDLGDRTILPGLIDAHMHFLGIDVDHYESLLIDSHVYRALRAAGEAERILRAGVTSVRCLGSPISPTLGRAISEGWITGPRVIASGQSLCSTGGTWDIVHADRRVVDLQDMLVDGVDNVRKAVRDRIRDGALVIKVGLSRGKRNDQSHGWGDDPTLQEVAYSRAEIEAIVDEAHASGVKVSAHCIGDGPVGAALDAGVDVIEHGFGINDETRARVASTGTPVITTFSGLVRSRAANAAAGASESTLAIADRHLARMKADFQAGIAAGVSFVIGSDLIGWPSQPQTAVLEEFALAVEWGFSPAEALVAGTVRGAEVLGLAGEIGELRAGFAADIVACAGDPTIDIAALKSIDFVMTAGVTRFPAA
jgi:imidazolonepropionase-like amidohydrolase